MGPDGPRFARFPLDGDGEPHTIRLRLETAADGPASADKLAVVWALGVADGESKQDLPLGDATPVVWRDPDRPGTGAAYASAPVAESNDAWRIDDLVDGVLVMLPETLLSVDVDELDDLLGAACAAVQADGRPCFAVFWGNDQWTIEIDPAVQSERIRVAATRTDGVVFYRFPLDLHGGAWDGDEYVPLHRGVFAEVEPFAPESFDRMGYWPLYAPGIPGWNQGWRTTLPCDGDWALTWADDAVAAGRFRERVTLVSQDGSSTVMLNADPSDSPDAGTEVFAGKAGDELLVEFLEEKGVGNSELSFQFRLASPTTAPEAGCDGSPRDDWVYSAGVDNDLARLYSAYETLLPAL